LGSIHDAARPVFEEWEAGFGRTFVPGSDPKKHKLREDVSLAFEIGKRYSFRMRKPLTTR
jgi:hypothetical protein